MRSFFCDQDKSVIQPPNNKLRTANKPVTQRDSVTEGKRSAANKRLVVSVAAFFLTLWVPSALADDCATVLQKTEVYKSSSVNLQIALLSMIEKSDYDEAKQNIDANLLFDPAMFSGSYDDFEKKLSTYKSTLHFTYTDQEMHAFATSYLPPQVTSAWLACEELKSQKRPRVSCNG